MGDDHEIRAAEVPRASLIDLGGRTVMPGLVDSHAHALDTGLRGVAVDLEGVLSVGEVCERIARGGPSFATGWVYAARLLHWELREARYPTIAELDAVCPDRPAFIMSVTGHSGATNSAGLRLIEAGAHELAGRTVASPEEAGWFPDDADGRRSRAGVVLGALDRRELADLYRSVAEQAAAKGVTTLHCLEGQVVPTTPTRTSCHSASPTTFPSASS